MRSWLTKIYLVSALSVRRTLSLVWHVLSKIFGYKQKLFEIYHNMVTSLKKKTFICFNKEKNKIHFKNEM